MRADGFFFCCMHLGTCLCPQMWLLTLCCGGHRGGRRDHAAIAPFLAAPRDPGSQGGVASHPFLLQDGAVLGTWHLCFGDLTTSRSPGGPGSGWVLGLCRCRKRLSPNWLQTEGLFLTLEAGRRWGPCSGFGCPQRPHPAPSPEPLQRFTGHRRDPGGSASRGWHTALIRGVCFWLFPFLH